MNYVIIRDDDTNALTPPEFLEQLYRPFLDRQLPVNLAVIPDVCTNTLLPDGNLEGFLVGEAAGRPGTRPIGTNPQLVSYLLDNPGYHVIQHGLSHAIIDGHYEFDRDDRLDCAQRLQRGTELLMQAGFPEPRVFVAPQDKLSYAALEEVIRRFDILSCGWYELRRIPPRWRIHYLLKKLRKLDHWQLKNTKLLTHPGCLLSRFKPCDAMLDSVKAAVAARPLTVLVTHWWEYFPQGQPDLSFITILHQVAEYLHTAPNLRVIPFSALLNK